MVELTPGQIADALRRCASPNCCDGCAYQQSLHEDCVGQMQRDAAAVIDGQAAVLDAVRQKLEQIAAM